MGWTKLQVWTGIEEGGDTNEDTAGFGRGIGNHRWGHGIRAPGNGTAGGIPGMGCITRGAGCWAALSGWSVGVGSGSGVGGGFMPGRGERWKLETGDGATGALLATGIPPPWRGLTIMRL